MECPSVRELYFLQLQKKTNPQKLFLENTWLKTGHKILSHSQFGVLFYQRPKAEQKQCQLPPVITGFRLSVPGSHTLKEIMVYCLEADNESFHSYGNQTLRLQYFCLFREGSAADNRCLFLFVF